MLFILTAFFSCESSEKKSIAKKKTTKTREVILDRHSNGEKKTVAIYKGKGLDEKIIKRITFNKDGKIELFENKLKNYTDYYFKGKLVKRNSGYLLDQNIFALIRSDTIKARILYEEILQIANDSTLARSILYSGSTSKFTGSTFQGNWVADGSFGLSNLYGDMNKFIYNYSISFWQNYISEFGNNFAKTYKIISLVAPKNPGSYKAGNLVCKYVEIDIGSGAVLSQEYSQNLIIKDPFTISFSPGSDLKRDEYQGIKRSQMLWD